jgi:hypothetical protein
MSIKTVLDRRTCFVSLAASSDDSLLRTLPPPVEVASSVEEETHPLLEAFRSEDVPDERLSLSLMTFFWRDGKFLVS